MPAYGFKRRFVGSIRVGLGIEPTLGSHPELPWPQAKRQTIRLGSRSRDGIARTPKGRRHARVGELISLYCGMRTKDCFLIGRGRCTAVRRVTIWLGIRDMSVSLDGKLLGPKKLKAFAQADGFSDAYDMAAFFRETHGDSPKWEGVVISWEPDR